MLFVCLNATLGYSANKLYQLVNNEQHDHEMQARVHQFNTHNVIKATALSLFPPLEFMCLCGSAQILSEYITKRDPKRNRRFFSRQIHAVRVKWLTNIIMC